MCGVVPHTSAPSVKQLKQLDAALVASHHLLSKQAKDAQMTSCVHPVVTGRPACAAASLRPARSPGVISE